MKGIGTQRDDGAFPVVLGSEEWASLNRILDATRAGGGEFVADFDNHDEVWRDLVIICSLWLPHARASHAEKAADKRRRRIVKALQLVLREFPLFWPAPPPVSMKSIKELEKMLAPKPSPSGKVKKKFVAQPISILSGLVGRLIQPFQMAFKTLPGYTTDPLTGETDSPFIRFVEQTLLEFQITKDGDQPYQRRSIADALNAFRKLHSIKEPRPNHPF
jgi:hypothetical protein